MFNSLEELLEKYKVLLLLDVTTDVRHNLPEKQKLKLFYEVPLVFQQSLKYRITFSKNCDL